jgi:hypothetical protein
VNGVTAHVCHILYLEFRHSIFEAAELCFWSAEILPLPSVEQGACVQLKIQGLFTMLFKVEGERNTTRIYFPVKGSTLYRTVANTSCNIPYLPGRGSLAPDHMANVAGGEIVRPFLLV